MSPRVRAALTLSLGATVAILFAIALALFIRNSVRPDPIIIPLEKESLTFTPTERLPHFYKKRNPGSVDHRDTTINSIGSNERYDYTLTKPEGVFRIVTLGDSSTYGLGVATKDNWTEVLEDTLNTRASQCDMLRFEVINLGVPGYDIEYAALRLEEDGLPYNPDLILWQVNQGDFETRREMELREMERLQKEIGTTTDIGLQKIINGLMEHYPKEETSLYQAQIFRDTVEKFGKSAGVFTAMGRIHHDGIMKLLAGTSGLTDLGFIPLKDSERLSKGDTHPNELGHARIALELFERLRTKGLIPCPLP